MVHGEAELEHPEEDQEDDRDDHRELDESLAAFARAAVTEAHQKIGSIRTAFDRENVRLLLPDGTNVPSGVLKMWVYRMVTAMKSGPPVCASPAVDGQVLVVGVWKLQRLTGG
jgi:hypothetical protein